MYTDYEILQLPLSVGIYRRRVEQFLAASGLRMDSSIDYYAVVQRRGNDEILAGGGLTDNIIKSIAVKETAREEGFSSRLISHLISQAHERGYSTVRVFTKPENKEIFESLSFQTVGQTDKAILLESGENNLSQYLEKLRKYTIISSEDFSSETPRQDADTSARKVKNAGCIVMNANPFTLGHRYLIEQSAAMVGHLYVIVVKEDLSMFSYEERRRMIAASCKDFSNVTVCDGSDYQISQSTFPTYFLKQIDDATDAQIGLDLDIFCRHIAPQLQITHRFVGSEPTDNLTRRYNELMVATLPKHGIEVVEIPRLCRQGEVISASRVRSLMGKSLIDALQLVPTTSYSTILSHIAADCLREELQLTPKPGLVDEFDSGAHTDMDYRLMTKSIDALQPFFWQIAQYAYESEAIETARLQQLGCQAEEAMMAATGGVNTHRGALFSVGIVIASTAQLLRINDREPIDSHRLQSEIIRLASGFVHAADTNGARVRSRYNNVGGALSMAQSGYSMLFDEWLPFYRKMKATADNPLHRLLLKIIATLEDTNILHRTDRETASAVKLSAARLLANFSLDGLQAMNEQFVRQNISPGGSADMLALTLMVERIIDK